MDRPTQPARDGEALPKATATSAGTSNVLIINSQPGYPNHIPISRYFRDTGDAADVKRLVWAVLGCETDGLLHYGDRGTWLVLRATAQMLLWGEKVLDTAPLVGLIRPVNHWLEERVGVIKGKRAVESRIEKSDAALDEFGYPDLRRTLLSLAGRKHKKLQILDAAGHGGVLEIPPRAHLISVQKTDKPVLPNGDVRILGIELFTQVVDYSGALVETLTAHVSSGVVEGGRACVRHPHKAAVHSRRVQHMTVVQQDQEHGDEEE